MASHNLRYNCRLNLDALDQRILPSTCAATNPVDTGHGAALRRVHGAVIPIGNGDASYQGALSVRWTGINSIASILVAEPTPRIVGTDIGNGSRGFMTDDADPV